MMVTSHQVFAVVLVFTVCQSALMVHATYIDCSMECLFAQFRQPTVCACKNTLKLHWGKRTPRTRPHSLPTFRYGKRSVGLGIAGNRMDTLRSIQDSYSLDSSEFDF